MAGTRHTTKAGRKNSCTGKTPFRSRERAHLARLRRIARGAAEWACSVYRCRFCGGFHVGHRSAPKHEARSRR